MADASVVQMCGCGEPATVRVGDALGTNRQCQSCKKPLCYECRERSDEMIGTSAAGDYCASCFEKA